MNKEELIHKAATTCGVSKKDTKLVLDALIAVIQDAVASNESVQLVNFGCLKLQHRKERSGHNPKTGEKLMIPPRFVPVFKPGIVLKQLINQQQSQ
jgi:DNA-binding protein HU-beta